MKRTLAALLIVFVTAAAQVTMAAGLSDSVRAQIESLQAEKAARTPAQRKMDSQLIYAVKRERNEPIAPGWNNVRLGVTADAEGMVLVDLDAAVTERLLNRITQSGGTVINSVPRFRAIRARVRLNQLESLAALPDVKFIRPADQAMAHVGRFNSEGDVTHNAAVARATVGLDGGGVKVGVLSDSVDFLAQSQASGELPTNLVVLPGQSGVPGSGEGTAMLEIVHDLAPGAELYFATAFGGQAGFAQNILDLRAAGCDIIVDDVRYFAESPFYDGIIAQAVNQVTADGAFYFSSAGNSGNQNDGTSGTWEGDFVDGGAAGTPVDGKGGRLHSFGANAYNTATGAGGGVFLHWSDPPGASTNDYDLYILDNNGANVIAMSTTVQNGAQNPIEGLVGPLVPGLRIVIVKATAAANRFLNIDTLRGQLAVSTSGEVKGHAVATNAFCVAAVDVATAYPNPFVGGAANPVEYFSSDGPRRVFFHADGSPITPGNFSATGGVVRLKPDIAAADGVQTSVPGFNRFFGTSAAAPHAAAIAALLKQRNTFLSQDEIRNILLASALDIEALGFDRDSGAGIVMAAEALRITPPGRGFNFIGTSVVGGNGNGLIDPNECNRLFVTLTNIGRTNAVAGTATLSTTTPGVTIVEPVAPFPFTLTNSVATNIGPFLIATSPDFVCGVPIDFEIVIASGTRMDTNRFQMRTGRILLAPALRNNNTPISIPDGNTNGVLSPINVSGVEGAIGKVVVSLYIEHAAPTNLIIDLISPDGTSVNLARKRGAAGLGYGTDCVPFSARTSFDDNAPRPISVAAPPFIGAFRPEQSLTAFYGKAGAGLNGQWALRVSDVDARDTGILRCWTLSIYPSVCDDGGGGTCTADLALTATAAPAPALFGRDLTYTITVTNSRPMAATSVRMTNSLPPGVAFVSAAASQGMCVLTNGTVLCDFGTVGSDSNVVGTIVVQPNFIGTLSNAFLIGSAEPDANPTNNVAVVISEVVQPLPAFVAADVQLVGESFVPATGGIESGETVTLAITLRNTGTGPSGNLLATLLEGNGVASPSGPQSYGAVPVGGSETRTFSFTAPGAPGSTIIATLALQDGANNLGTLTFQFAVGGDVVFANTAPIVINTLGAASPYPATINVSGVEGVVGKVRASFVKLAHTYPDDIDALLVGPRGQRLVLMSDAGGGSAVTNLTLTFDDAAATRLPNETVLAPGSFQVTDYLSGTEPGGDVFPAPAPVGSLSSSLAAFNSTDPNGTWSLFIHDDGGNDSGVVAGGWSLLINTVRPVNPVANLAVSTTVSPNPAIAGEPFTIAVTVFNAGPSNAPAVVLTNVLAAGIESGSAAVTRGTVTLLNGVATASFGTLTNGESATLTLTLVPNSVGFRTNVAAVSAASTDLNPANNTVRTVYTVSDPASDLALNVTAAPEPVFVSSNLTFVATVTNRGPNHAEAVRLTNRLAAGLSFVSASSSQGSCSLAAGVVTCNLGDLATNGTATVTIVATANSAGTIESTFGVASDFADVAPANNTVMVTSTAVPLAPLIVASGAALTAENPGPANGSLDAGESVSLSLGLRNAGTAPTANLVASLLASGGVVSPSAAQSYGALAAGGPTVARPFSFVVGGAPGSTLTATLQLQDGAQNLGTVAFSFVVSASRSFTNGNVIIIPNYGAATNYPSTLTVSGITGAVNKVTVNIRQLTHSWPEDIDMLLVGPAGQKVLLMSDAGAGNAINNVNLTLDDTAGAIPFATTIGSGAYRPTDYQPGDTIPAPAPAGPYGTNLSVFNGVNPNGVWSLYVVDDAAGDAGRIEGGWSLNIQTASPVPNSADVSVTATAPANVESGAPFSYNITVANHGPGVATAVTLNDPLPPTFIVSGVTVSQGSFSTSPSAVTANFGTLNPGASATMTISGAAVGPRVLTNRITVAASPPDPNLGNNTTSPVTVVAAPVLVIRRSGTNAVLTWRSPATGYLLESSMTATGVWSAAGLPVLTANGTNSATAPTIGTKFFRLRQ